MIKTAVMSYWSMNKTDLVHQFSFTDLCMWALSACLIKSQFKKLVFFCDNESKSLFVDGLNLPFDEVRNELYNVSPLGLEKVCWASGKVLSFSLMDEPFIHLDGDVFLTKEIDKKLLTRPIISQSTSAFAYETVLTGKSYSPFHYKTFIPHLPDKFKNSLDRKWHQIGCFGLFGGEDNELIKEACSISREISHHPENYKPLLNLTSNGFCGGMFLEEYTISTIAQVSGTQMYYLLNSEDIHCEASSIGFTHLAGNAKREPISRTRARIRLLKIFPDVYKRVESFARENKLRYD